MKISSEIWAVIPARSGSKGVKNKNIKYFIKKPLIDHSIISAKKNHLIDKVLFSSDSKKYISMEKKFNSPSSLAVNSCEPERFIKKP